MRKKRAEFWGKHLPEKEIRKSHRDFSRKRGRSFLFVFGKRKSVLKKKIGSATMLRITNISYIYIIINSLCELIKGGYQKGTNMAINDQFCNPKGFIGRLMLAGMNMGHSPMAKWGFSQFEIPQKADIVDIGCGGGYNIKRFLKACPKGHVFGVDISEESVRKSSAVNKKDIGIRCRIVQANVDRLPFKNHKFDIATAFETVYFWPDPPENFKEVRRILKKGGHFIVINDPGDPEKHWEEKIPGMKAYTAEQIAVYMRDAGFADIQISRKKHMFCVNGATAE